MMATVLRGRPAVSIAIQGGLVKILIPPTDISTTMYPVIGREIFTNTKDDQKQLKFRVYQGWGSRIDQNKIMGEFSLYFDTDATPTTNVLRKGNTVVKAGSMKIQVAMRLLEDGSLQAEARDLVKKTSLGWTFTLAPT
jgi:molecular chaperone DnaK (HSP70)